MERVAALNEVSHDWEGLVWRRVEDPVPSLDHDTNDAGYWDGRSERVAAVRREEVAVDSREYGRWMVLSKLGDLALLCWTDTSACGQSERGLASRRGH